MNGTEAEKSTLQVLYISIYNVMCIGIPSQWKTHKYLIICLCQPTPNVSLDYLDEGFWQLV